ncbi:MAG: hypothetical protein C6H99_03815 [Epsilonproteobacteria bacterium]|nr:hypothetical protein [Campylobacterota bacterium]NPA64935.1 DUF2442 domain-containing protein [Campylobacterota bacterium]
MSTLMYKYSIEEVEITDEGIAVTLHPYKRVILPFDYTPKIAQASKKELEKFRILPNGRGIHFESIDKDIGVEGIVRDFLSEAA